MLDHYLLGAASDSSLTLFDTQTTNQTLSFPKQNVQGLAFSPLNKLLLCCVSSDATITFYDINEKKLVKQIQTGESLTSVAFCQDGHTIAVGARNSGNVMIYDLRKSAREVYKYCTGHKETVNTV